MSERSRPHKSPERNHPVLDRIGLQTRLLIGEDALNPVRKDLAPNPDKITHLAWRDYVPYENASRYERSKYWKGKESGDLKKQKKAWAAQVTASFQGKKFEDHQHELLERMGINSRKFSEKDALNLYERYFEKKNDSVKHFVKDLFLIHVPESSDVLEKNMPTIKWLAGIFGGRSSEVVTQLTLAETFFRNKRGPFYKEDLKDKVNNLSQQEVELLEFIWKHGVKQKTPATPGAPRQPRTPRAPQEPRRPAPPARREPPTPREPQRGRPRLTRPFKLPNNYKKTYVRPEGDPRRMPVENVDQMFHPLWIANELKKKHPAEFGNHNLTDLSQQIQREKAGLTSKLQKLSLGETELKQLGDDVIDQYREFVNHTYGIKLPKIAGMKIYPVSGDTARAFAEHGSAYAFVFTSMPVLFINFDVVETKARQLGQGSWYDLGPDQARGLLSRLLLEIFPHEYTHLTSELEFLRVIKSDEHGNRKTVLNTPRRSGVDVGKARITGINADGSLNYEYTHRGIWLHEAIDEELVRRWALETYHSPLDIEGYAEERIVLYNLINLLQQEQGVSGNEIFKKFVKAHFKKKDLMPLVKALDGRRKSTEGNITYDRPYFTSIVFALMNYEHEKAVQYQQHRLYPLTVGYVQGQYSDLQAQEVLAQIDNLNLSAGARKRLMDQLTLPIAEAA